MKEIFGYNASTDTYAIGIEGEATWRIAEVYGVNYSPVNIYLSNVEDEELYKRLSKLSDMLDNEYITATEAAELWGLDESTVKKSCQLGRFKTGEYRKSGKVWLVRISAMKRLYD